MNNKNNQKNQIRKLGKKAPRLDSRNLKLANYLKPGVTFNPPAESSWVVDVPSWGMMENDQLGDCVIAGAGHSIQQWTFYVKEKLGQGQMVVVPDNQILTAYEKVGGYVPGDPSTDNGCDMLTALKYWRKTGIGGHKILAFVQVDPTKPLEWMSAIELFGNLYIGLALPLSAQNQEAWTVPDGGPEGDGSPGSWGGHCVPIMAYSPQSLTCVTWGQTLKMSHNFFAGYCDEAYAVLSQDWLDAQQVAPSSFNLAQLQEDLAAL